MPSSLLRILLLSLFSLPLLGFDNVTPQPIEILPHWKKGDSFDLIITRTREKSTNGTSTISGKTHTRFTIEVLQANAKGYLIGWTAGETTFEAPIPSESFLRQVVGLMKGLQIVLQIDTHGTITGVQNWEALRDATLKTMDELLSKPPNSSKGQTDTMLLSKLRVQWETMFSTKAQVEQLCTRDARTYFKVLGRSYSQDRPYEYDDFLPNPLGGESFPANAQITMTSYDHVLKHAILTWKQRADSQQARRILEAMVKGLTERQGKKSPQGELAKTITLEDHAEITVDVDTGWVSRLILTQSVNLGTRGQTDTTSIVRIVK